VFATPAVLGGASVLGYAGVFAVCGALAVVGLSLLLVGVRRSRRSAQLRHVGGADPVREVGAVEAQ
jgi:hypothetical protein